VISWIADNAATIIVGAILLIAVALAIRYMIKNAKKGLCIGCDQCCKNGCRGSGDDGNTGGAAE